MLVVICYDVSTVEPEGQRRLRRVAKVCKDYGQRAQLSVFECEVDPAQWTVLRQKLLDEVNLEEDSLKFYFLGANWRRRVEQLGAKNHMIRLTRCSFSPRCEPEVPGWLIWSMVL